VLIFHYFLINKGLRANQKIAGKKCIVMAKVGKITVKYSSKSKGNLCNIGEIKLAKIKAVKMKLKTISPYFGIIFMAAKKPIEAKTHPNIHAAKRFSVVNIFEKSYMNSSLSVE
jgi:hypothetical protein